MLAMSKLEKILVIENVLVRLIKSEHFFELCTGRDGVFWPAVQNAFGESVCLLWCHLFGSHKDDLHYSCFFDDSTEGNFSASSVKQRMLSAMSLSDCEYKQLWKEVKDCRDKFVSHKEYGALIAFPRISLCRLQAEELRRILADYTRERDIAEPGIGWEYWAEYYTGQWLRERQFRDECEQEFTQGVVSAAKNLANVSQNGSAHKSRLNG